MENFGKNKWKLVGKEINMSAEGSQRRAKELGLGFL
jgi:hypothetical protein